MAFESTDFQPEQRSGLDSFAFMTLNQLAKSIGKTLPSDFVELLEYYDKAYGSKYVKALSDAKPDNDASKDLLRSAFKVYSDRQDEFLKRKKQLEYIQKLSSDSREMDQIAKMDADLGYFIPELAESDLGVRSKEIETAIARVDELYSAQQFAKNFDKLFDPQSDPAIMRNKPRLSVAQIATAIHNKPGLVFQLQSLTNGAPDPNGVVALVEGLESAAQYDPVLEVYGRSREAAVALAAEVQESAAGRTPVAAPASYTGARSKEQEERVRRLLYSEHLVAEAPSAPSDSVSDAAPSPMTSEYYDKSIFSDGTIKLTIHLKTDEYVQDFRIQDFVSNEAGAPVELDSPENFELFVEEDHTPYHWRDGTWKIAAGNRLLVYDGTQVFIRRKGEDYPEAGELTGETALPTGEDAVDWAPLTAGDIEAAVNAPPVEPVAALTGSIDEVPVDASGTTGTTVVVDGMEDAVATATAPAASAPEPAPEPVEIPFDESPENVLSEAGLAKLNGFLRKVCPAGYSSVGNLKENLLAKFSSVSIRSDDVVKMQITDLDVSDGVAFMRVSVTFKNGEVRKLNSLREYVPSGGYYEQHRKLGDDVNEEGNWRSGKSAENYQALAGLFAYGVLLDVEPITSAENRRRDRIEGMSTLDGARTTNVLHGLARTVGLSKKQLDVLMGTIREKSEVGGADELILHKIWIKSGVAYMQIEAKNNTSGETQMLELTGTASVNFDFDSYPNTSGDFVVGDFLGGEPSEISVQNVSALRNLLVASVEGSLPEGAEEEALETAKERANAFAKIVSQRKTELDTVMYPKRERYDDLKISPLSETLRNHMRKDYASTLGALYYLKTTSQDFYEPEALASAIADAELMIKNASNTQESLSGVNASEHMQRIAEIVGLSPADGYKLMPRLTELMGGNVDVFIRKIDVVDGVAHIQVDAVDVNNRSSVETRDFVAVSALPATYENQTFRDYFDTGLTDQTSPNSNEDKNALRILLEGQILKGETSEYDAADEVAELRENRFQAMLSDLFVRKTNLDDATVKAKAKQASGRDRAKREAGEELTGIEADYQALKDKFKRVAAMERVKSDKALVSRIFGQISQIDYQIRAI